MDQIEHALSEAAAFQRENKQSCAYYKLLKAVILALNLLSDEVLFQSQTSQTKSSVEGIFTLMERCLSRAEGNLEAVLDLDETVAARAKESAILGFNPYSQVGQAKQQQNVTPNLERVEAYQTVPLQQSSPKQPTTVESKLDNYGPEPEFGVRDDADLPLIPYSCLSIVHCQLMLQLQLVIQKLDPFIQANAKQQANALYLSSLETLIERLRKITLRKLDQEDGIKMVEMRTIRDHSPADLARQITLLQHTLLRKITVEELKLAGGGIKNREFLVPNLSVFLALSQYFTHWCQYEVLRWSQDQDRAATMTLLVRVAAYLLEIGNFDGMVSLVKGLTSRPTYRLRSTLALLPKKTRIDLSNMEVLISDRRDYAQLRNVLEGRATPLIPPLSIMLVDRERRKQVIMRWDRIRTSAYDELFVVQPLTQHYILTQPFRWEEELQALSLMRESPSKEYDLRAERGGSGDLATRDLERWSYGESDQYELLGRTMTRYSNVISPLQPIPPHPSAPSPPTFSLR